jgi:hypothetical protein
VCGKNIDKNRYLDIIHAEKEERETGRGWGE